MNHLMLKLLSKTLGQRQRLLLNPRLYLFIASPCSSITRTAAWACRHHPSDSVPGATSASRSFGVRDARCATPCTCPQTA